MFSAAEAPRFLELVQCYKVNIPTQIAIIVYMSTVQLSTQKQQPLHDDAIRHHIFGFQLYNSRWRKLPIADPTAPTYTMSLVNGCDYQ